MGYRELFNFLFVDLCFRQNISNWLTVRAISTSSYFGDPTFALQLFNTHLPCRSVRS